MRQPGDAWRKLERELDVLVLQTGEVGPIAQALAGIDTAVWDLAAPRDGLPLYRRLGAGWAETVPVYATGLNPDAPERFVLRQEAGHRAFKLKIGFKRELDLRNIAALRHALGDDATLMANANQALDFTQAAAAAAAAPFGLRWLEEPLRVDRPAAEWEWPAALSPIPLAGRENLRDPGLHRAATPEDVLQAIQPDITKWGGITGNPPVAREAVGNGKAFCPHVFGGGFALLALLHLPAAVGGGGLPEFDWHPNAGRELVAGSLLPVGGGRVPVPQSPGLGARPDLQELRRFQTWPA